MLYTHIKSPPTQNPRSRPISILLRHTSNPIRGRKRIKLLPLPPLILHAPIVPAQLTTRLAVYQSTLFANVDRSQGHHASVFERAADVAELGDSAAGAGVAYGPGSVFAVVGVGGGDAADVPDFELVIPYCC